MARVDVRDRGHIAVHPHVYTDKGVCNSCGRKRLNKKVNRTVISMMLFKGWRTVAYPYSYRVQRLAYPAGYGVGRPVWVDVQRFPRQRNVWDLQAVNSAVCMMERRFMEAKAKETHTVQNAPSEYRPFPKWKDWRTDTARLVGMEWRNRVVYQIRNRYYRYKWRWQEFTQRCRARCHG